MTTMNHKHLILLLSLFLAASLACNAISSGPPAVEEEPAAAGEAAVAEEPTAAVQEAPVDEQAAEEETTAPQTFAEEQPAAEPQSEADEQLQPAAPATIAAEETEQPEEQEMESPAEPSPTPTEPGPVVYQTDGNPCVRPVRYIFPRTLSQFGQAETVLPSAGTGDNDAALRSALPHPNLQAAAVTTAGRDLIVTLGEYNPDTGQNVSVWDAATGQELQRLPAGEEVHTLAVGAHSPVLATMADDGDVWLWGLPAASDSSGRPFVNTGANGALALSPDGRFLAIGSTASETVDQFTYYWGVIDIYDVQTGDRIQHLEGDVNPGTYDDGSIVESASVSFGHANSINALAFSPNGEALLSVSGGDQTMRLWDVASGEPLRCFEFPQGRSSSAASFNYDGREIATVSGSSILIWDTASSGVSREIDLLNIMDVEMETVVFSPADMRLITTSADEKAAYIWDTESGDLSALIRHPGYVSSAAVSANGQWIVTSMIDPVDEQKNEARIWQADHESLALAARAQVFVVAAFEAAEQGDIAGMKAFLQEAESISGDDGILLRPGIWDRACRYGLFAGQAGDILEECDKAVNKADEIANSFAQRGVAARYHDSRGLALALAGRAAEAAADFQYFVDNMSFLQANDADLRRFWIAEIEAGRNPIDEAALEELRTE